MKKFIPKLPLKPKQIIGDATPIESIPDEEHITALQFDQSGTYFAIGDKAGRIIIFENSENEKGEMEYQYFTELQSHVREYDYLKSTEIEEKIQEIQWLRPQYKSLYLITTNEKFIKIWKIGEKSIRKELPHSNSRIIPQYEVIDVTFQPKLHSEFPNLHSFNINYIGVTSNEEYLISSDDFRINLWSLQSVKKAYNVIDIKPNNAKEANEIITSCCIHPTEDSLFVYSTSEANVNLVDLRIGGALCNRNVSNFKETKEPNQNFLLNLISSISDVKFSKDASLLVTRDFLNLMIWDIRDTSKPLSKTCLFEPLKSRLCELYDNDSIFERFNIATSSCSDYIATGNFNSSFHILNRYGENHTMHQLTFSKENLYRSIPNKMNEKLPSDFSYIKRVNKLVFHPVDPCIGISYLNSIFFYSL